MAILWIEGFEAFGTTNGNAPIGLQPKYLGATADSTFLVEAGRLGGHSMRFASGAPYVQTSNLGNVVTIIVGFGFYQDAFTNAQDILRLYDGNVLQGSFTINTGGTFKYFKGGSGGSPLGTTSSGATASTWCYVELKVKIDGTVGTVDVLVNDVNVLSLTSQNTKQSTNARVNTVQLMGSQNGPDHTQFDDWYVMDTTGSVNTTYLGKQTTTCLLLPSGDAGTNQFTTDSGSTHYDRVNNNPPDSDTSYLQDSTSGHVELFTMPTFSGIANVAGCQLNTVARITDANDFSLKNEIVSGGTTSDDTAQPIPGPDYLTLSRVVETDPHTSAAWVQSAFNAAQFGFKVG